jgi:hypothetical protein
MYVHPRAAHAKPPAYRRARAAYARPGACSAAPADRRSHPPWDVLGAVRGAEVGRVRVREREPRRAEPEEQRPEKRAERGRRVPGGGRVRGQLGEQPEQVEQDRADDRVERGQERGELLGRVAHHWRAHQHSPAYTHPANVPASASRHCAYRS